MPKTTLVTGGAGFIGSHLVDRLLKERYKVVVVDNLSTGKKENLNPKAKFYKVDICSPKISRIFKKEKPEAVFHYAAQSHVRESTRNPIKDAKINILGSLNLLQNFIQQGNKKGKKKFIFASSCAVYGQANVIPIKETCPVNPLSPYGISKLTIERYLGYYKTLSLQYIVLRMGNVFGPRQNPRGEAGVVAIFFGKKQPVINGNGKQTCDFVYIDDVIEANILTLKSGKTGVFNVGSAIETDINTIFRKIKELKSSRCKKIHGPKKNGEPGRICLDFAKVKKELGWQPKYSLDVGLKKTMNWFQRII